MVLCWSGFCVWFVACGEWSTVRPSRQVRPRAGLYLHRRPPRRHKNIPLTVFLLNVCFPSDVMQSRQLTGSCGTSKYQHRVADDADYHDVVQQTLKFVPPRCRPRCHRVLPFVAHLATRRNGVSRDGTGCTHTTCVSNSHSCVDHEIPTVNCPARHAQYSSVLTLISLMSPLIAARVVDPAALAGKDQQFTSTVIDTPVNN